MPETAALPPNLSRNLETLQLVNKALAKRLLRLGDTSHLSLEEGGRAYYQIHRDRHAFSLTPENVPGLCAHIDGSKSVLLFGVGLGEILIFLLNRFPTLPVVAWDRDPGVMNLALSLADYSTEITAGRLTLALGPDLIKVRREMPSLVVVEHPVLSQIYSNEREILRNGVMDKRALICAGTLFVDDLSRALQDEHYSVYTLDSTHLPIEEMIEVDRALRPQLIATINYPTGLAEFCDQQKRKMLCWEIDPATDPLGKCESPTKDAYIFTYRDANVAEFKKAGFKHVRYLPLAADIKKRRPLELTPAEKASYGVPVAFVGSSMRGQAEQFSTLFLGHYAQFLGGKPEHVQEAHELLSHLLVTQRQDFSRYSIPELMQEKAPGFLNAMRSRPDADDPLILVGEIAAAEKRLRYVSELGAAVGISVWGDNGWQELGATGVSYRGSAGHNVELTKIYNAAQINIDVNRLYQTDIITMRVFDIMACGGFVIAEHSDALTQAFSVGVEIESYKTLAELLEKTRFYLAHPDERAQIAAAGMQRVHKDHSIPARLSAMLRTMKLKA